MYNPWFFLPVDLHECCMAWLGHSYVLIFSNFEVIPKLPHSKVITLPYTLEILVSNFLILNTETLALSKIEFHVPFALFYGTVVPHKTNASRNDFLVDSQDECFYGRASQDEFFLLLFFFLNRVFSMALRKMTISQDSTACGTN